MLNEWITDWLLPNWILDGQIELPEGWTVDDVAADVGWMGAGLPSWRMLRHVKELILALQCGLLPPSEVIGDYGYDIAKNLADIAGLQAKAAELGIAVPFGKDTNQNVGL
jgi:capsid protein